MVKEVFYDDGRWHLRSWNPSAEPVEIEGGQLLGYLVGISSRDGGLKIGPHESGITRRLIEEMLLSRVNL